MISRRESADWSPPDLTVTVQPGDYLADTLNVLVAAERECSGFIDLGSSRMTGAILYSPSEAKPKG